MDKRRTTYWTSSKFADWLRGSHKLKHGTSEEWDDWHTTSRKKNPIRYWLAEEGLWHAQNFVMFPIDLIYTIKLYIVNRFISKTHALTSNLKKGQWHEFDERVLHCLFDELVNFVEIEAAWNHGVWNDDIRVNAPWYAFGWLRTRTWRCPELGIEHLEWASKLTDEEFREEDDKVNAQPTAQALHAQELLVLYNWWKNVRPTRPDPHSESGWSKIYEEHSKNGSFFRSKKTPEEREKINESLDLLHEIEERYENEDTEMLIRLIKIRQGMWT